MSDQMPGGMRSPGTRWSTKKRDDAPRGVYVHPSSTRRARICAIRYTCGAGHIHKEKVGTIKGDAIRTYHDRRARARDEPGWCPATEREHARAQAAAVAARERAHLTFKAFAEQHYLPYAKGPQALMEDGSESDRLARGATRREAPR
jgi:hypothetical protein